MVVWEFWFGLVRVRGLVLGEVGMWVLFWGIYFFFGLVYYFFV